MERELENAWKRYKKNGDQEAKEYLFARYAPMVKHIALKIAAGLPSHVDVDDLISSGVVGLIEAFKRFDLSRGLKFETYATPCVRGGILQQLRDLDWLPRSTRRRAQELERTCTRLEHELGRQPTEDELAEAMGVELSNLYTLMAKLARASMVSLDQMWESSDDESGGGTIADAVSDTSADAPSLAMEREEVKNILAEALENLPPQERLVITLYYYEDLTLKEIGKVLSVSESRVSQIHAKAATRLSGRLVRLRESLV